MRSSTEHLSFKLLRGRLFWRIAARVALSRIRLKCKCTYLHTVSVHLFIFIRAFFDKGYYYLFYYYCYCIIVTQVSSKTKIWSSRSISNQSNFPNTL